MTTTPQAEADNTMMIVGITGVTLAVVVIALVMIAGCYFYRRKQR